MTKRDELLLGIAWGVGVGFFVAGCVWAIYAGGGGERNKEFAVFGITWGIFIIIGILFRRNLSKIDSSTPIM